MSVVDCSGLEAMDWQDLGSMETVSAQTALQDMEDPLCEVVVGRRGKADCPPDMEETEL